MRKQGKRFVRRIDPLAAFRSADRQLPLDAGQKTQLGVVLRTHLEALRLGKADEVAFHRWQWCDSSKTGTRGGAGEGLH